MRKRLPEGLVLKISDFDAESKLSLPPYAIEKDFHVFDAIRVITSAPKSDLFRLVFCGGTCISKAYGVLDRMSEDVDFKIVPTKKGAALGGNPLRTALSKYVKSLGAALEQTGFGDGSVTRTSMDANNYSRLDIEFESAFDKPESLRPHLLVEMNYTKLAKEPEMRGVGLLLDTLVSGTYSSPLNVECVSLDEAVAEKLVSFPRRLALQLSSHEEDPSVALREESGWDKSLVRHLYDVHRIVSHKPDLANGGNSMGLLIDTVITKDAMDFRGKHPEFLENPLGELAKAVQFAKGSRELAAQYEAFVKDMVYASPSVVPSFDQALGIFDMTLRAFLSSSHTYGKHFQQVRPARKIRLRQSKSEK